MPTITLPKQLQAVQRLPFCYLCGENVVGGAETNRDHVPPKGCFATVDRSSPLILRTHVACNDSRKLNDETVGQYFAPLSKKDVSPENWKVKSLALVNLTSGDGYGFHPNVNLYGEIERWVRAFHAALYRELCPHETKFGTQTPMPVAIPTEAGPALDHFHPMHLNFVKLIKENRAAGNVDRLACNNGKVRYECVWKHFEDGWHCIFALDLYGWGKLGRAAKFPAHGCTGHYLMPSGAVPVLATKATTLVIPTRNFEPSDPFAS